MYIIFPITIDGEALTKTQLKRKKVLACRLILLSVSDDLIDIVADYSDRALASRALKNQFHFGDQSEILTLMS